MEVLDLLNDVTDVTARLIMADKKYTNYINNIYELKNIRYANDLFVVLGGRSLDFGSIEYMEVYYKSGKEYWDITTSKSCFKFQILNKPKRIELRKSNKKEVGDVFKKRRLLNEKDNAFNAIFNGEFDIAKMTLPWKV